MIFLGFYSKLNGVAEFFPANSPFSIYFGSDFLLQPVNGGFGVRVLCVIVQPPKHVFLVNKVQDGLTDRRFGVVAAVHFRCGCIDYLHEFVT